MHVFENTIISEFKFGFMGISMVGQTVKESACNEGGLGQYMVRKIPWRREWLHTPVFLAGESHGQRSQASYSPCGRKE